MSYHKRGSSRYQLHSTRGLPSGSSKGLHGGKGFGKDKGYGQDKYPSITVAKKVFESRSQRAKTMDLLKMAEIAPSVSAWLKCPNRLDLLGLDTPDAALVFSHRSKRSQAQDLARAARRKVGVEVWIGDPSKVDLRGVDTPGSKKPKPRRFKVVEKGEAKKLELKRAESKKTEAEEKKHTLPFKEQIIQRAQELHKEELVKQGLPVISAEEGELKESGTFEKAREDLMRTESKVDSQVLEYVANLNSELEPMGFRVVEID